VYCVTGVRRINNIDTKATMIRTSLEIELEDRRITPITSVKLEANLRALKEPSKGTERKRITIRTAEEKQT